MITISYLIALWILREKVKLEDGAIQILAAGIIITALLDTIVAWYISWYISIELFGG